MDENKKMREISKKLKAARTALDKWEGIQSELEQLISPFCDFEIFVDVVAGDGIIVGNYDTSNVAPIDYVIAHTRKHKSLSEKDHIEMCI